MRAMVIRRFGAEAGVAHERMAADGVRGLLVLTP